MPPAHAAINPLLAAVLTGKTLEELGTKPTISQLPGKYTKLVNKHKKKLEAPYEPNKFYLICGDCGSKRQYDLGLIALDLEGYARDQGPGDVQMEVFESGRMLEYIQSTGYFRCKECNHAGNWAPADSKLAAALTSFIIAAAAGNEESSSFFVGKLLTTDGSASPCWVTDTEEQFLQKLPESQDQGYLWNRLGNLYQKGGRPELAAAAFERSLELSPDQAESHFSLGKLLYEAEELLPSAYHLRMVLLYARGYKQMDKKELRSMVGLALRMLYGINQQADSSIPYLPTAEEVSAVLQGAVEAAAVAEVMAGPGFELDLEQEETFLLAADLILGVPEAAPAQPAASVKPAFSGRPVVVRVKSKEKAKQIGQLSLHYGLECSIHIHFKEDVEELRKALVQKLTPSDVYSPCFCGSGSKFRFCCAKKMKRLDLDQMIADLGL